ncbi:MAG: protein-L-isoaspartate(D-aspartate) O-methyltransferase [Candidatus Eisenbacteria bacterium]|nr:protein-L-isoaspartate(D-aspartate) O-methyltransferase [Candidatus Eisenbacteria bacterium]
MVREGLVGRGIRDKRVLEVMAQMPRHVFVDEALWPEAYGEHALPIGHGQTMSQPYIVARMCELLKLSGPERVLEVGLGSGYNAAVLSKLTRSVFAIERIPELAERARRRLESLGIKNVIVRIGDGRAGWKSFAPFDRIVVSAAAPEIPSRLSEQLADLGRMVLPVGVQEEQCVVLLERRGDKVLRKEVERVRFVPLVGGRNA